MSDSPFFAELIDEIDKVFRITLGPSLFAKSSKFIADITPVFGLGFSIYVLLVLWQMYKSGLDELVIGMVKQAVGWLIIIMCAFNADEYAKLATWIYGFPDELAASVTGNNLSNSAIKTGIINVHQIGSSMFSWAYKKLGFTDIVVPLVSMLVSVAVMMLGLIAFLLLWFYYLVTKVSLSLTLLIGPLFLGAMLFPSTRQYGMNWIGQCFNYSVTVALFATISTLQINFVEARLAVAQAQLAGGISTVMEIINILIFFTIFTVIAIIVALNVPNIAQALTGGATVESGARKISSAINPTKKLLNRVIRGK